MEIGRNDLCWCGSGKKYKKCHMRRPRLKTNVKTASEIDGMRAAGAFNGQLLDYIRPCVKAGMSTGELDRLIDAYTRQHGHVPATKGYRGYAKSCCISINEVVCHGIPSDERLLRDGDIVNVDVTSIVDSWYGDQSETFLIGNVEPEARRLVETTARALLAGIDAVRVGQTLNVVARAVGRIADAAGYSVIRDYTGHGIGREFHEMYSVFHHETPEADKIVLEPGMTFTVEPMLNEGTWDTDLDSDGWTVYTKDRKLSAQFEHTVLVTESGAEVLTLTPAQRAAGKRLIVDGIGAFD